jgi:hypothetical protein
LSSALGFERAEEWQATLKGTVQGFQIYKVLDQHTILFVEEAELIFSENRKGRSTVCLKYKTGKLNSRRVLHLAPGYTDYRWQRAADAIDSVKGFSCVQLLRQAGYIITPGLRNEFGCRRPSEAVGNAVGGAAAAAPCGPWSSADFITGTTIVLSRGRSCSSAETSTAAKNLRRVWCVRRNNLGRSGSIASETAASATGRHSNPEPDDVCRATAAAVPCATDHGSQLSGETDGW